MARVPDDRLPDCATCPAARVVQGATLGDSGVICGVMEDDAKRADPILEGAPIGVFVRLCENPRTLARFCFGTAQPTPDPDVITDHYTSCPVYAAGKEIHGMERAFAFEKPVGSPHSAVPGVDAGVQEPTDDEMAFRD